MKEKLKTKKSILIIVGVVLVGIVSILLFREINEPTDLEEQTSLKEKATISQDAAESIALKAVPGSVIQTRLDDEDWAKIVYEILIQTDTNVQEVVVNAKDGDIEKIDLEDDYIPLNPNSNNTGQNNKSGQNDSNTGQNNATGQNNGNTGQYSATGQNDGNTGQNNATGQTPATKISEQEAKDIALARFSGTVIQTEFDLDNGVYNYEFLIRNGNQAQEIKVNAETGEITEIDIE